MKISQSLLFAYAAAQGEDRWGSTDYYSFNYGFGNDGGRQDAGLAFGLSENPSQAATDQAGYDGIDGLYSFNRESAHYKDQLHYNGLLCWMCDFRLDLATEAEVEDCDDSTCQNAYARCLKHGMLMRCRGEQRTCMFEERRRHGVVYSVCTGCKQTDACVAHWRRNQRFTLPFMNFGDMSLRNLPQRSGNLPMNASSGTAGFDQLPNHRPIYVDDECSTYQETRNEAAWRKTVNDPGTVASPGSLTASSAGTNSEVYPMGWIPAQISTNVYPNGSYPSAVNPYTGVAQVASDGELDFNTQDSRSQNRGRPFTTDGTAATLQFTGHRVNVGLSYSKFAYDGANDLQLNAQLSQWESTCRWCCHARPDTICNIEMKEINSSPFATKCGNNIGTRRDATVDVHGDATGGNPSTDYRFTIHPLHEQVEKFETAILSTNANTFVNNQRAYWDLLSTITGSINALGSTGNNGLKNTGTAPSPLNHFACSLSNAQWDSKQQENDLTQMLANNRHKIPQGIHNKFRFFQPFNIAQATADYFNADLATCGTGSGANFGNICTSSVTHCNGGTCDTTTKTGAYVQGPRFWMQMFQRTPQYDLSHWYGVGTTDYFTAKFPATGEGRNAAGMDKFAGRGNKSRWTLDADTVQANPELQHFFQQQTDMVSQENRDFFDSRARDAATSIDANRVYLKRWDNPHWTNK